MVLHDKGRQLERARDLGLAGAAPAVAGEADVAAGPDGHRRGGRAVANHLEAGAAGLHPQLQLDLLVAVILDRIRRGQARAVADVLAAVVVHHANGRLVMVLDEDAKAIEMALVAGEMDVVLEELDAPRAGDQLRLAVGVVGHEVLQDLRAVLLDIPHGKARVLRPLCACRRSLHLEGEVGLEVAREHRREAEEHADATGGSRAHHYRPGSGDCCARHVPLVGNGVDVGRGREGVPNKLLRHSAGHAAQEHDCRPCEPRAAAPHRRRWI
mmetsp:Transcript_43894/g.113394  ORF Transcript_43894/g.113394 Transcript_43894/m.113394 type:complete len:269 (+) Transcript_43894:694-1500(+)